MATTNEQLKSVIGVPDPKADPDNATLRAVAGVASFGLDGTPATGSPSGPVFSPVLSPVNPPLELLHALGLA